MARAQANASPSARAKAQESKPRWCVSERRFRTTASFENPEFEAAEASAAIRDGIAQGGPRLGEVIGPRDRRRLASVLTLAGRPENEFDNLLTWQVYPPLSELVDSLNGVQPRNIPERVLRALAKQQGKLIRSEWRSMKDIMEFSKSQTTVEHLQLIAKTLDGLDSPSTVRRNASDWAAGDISAAAEHHHRLKENYPELTEMLVTKRNMRWVELMHTMLSSTQCSFVCVGLGHLVGEESIQVLAARNGLVAKRV